MKLRSPGLRHLLVLLSLTSGLASAFGAAAPAAPAAGPLDWPAITSQTKPWSRWWWLASIGTDRDFTVEMEKYAQAGLGGLEITPIYGVRGEESRFVDYLSPAWVRRLEYVLREGKRLNLGIDMANGNGWPFGGPNVGDEDSARYVAHKVWKVAAGAKLVLLDNMSIEELKESVGIAKPAGAQTEASGGLTIDQAWAVARTGVDYLSVGALTHSAASLDIGLDLR